MDVVYDFVEGIHVLIPVIAVLFIIATVYFGKSGEDKSEPEKTTSTEFFEDKIVEKSKDD